MKKIILLTFTLLFITTLALAQDKYTQDSKVQKTSSIQDKKARTSMVDSWKPVQYQSLDVNIFMDDMNGDNSVTGLEARGWIVLNEDGGGTTDPYYQGRSAAYGGAFDAFEGPDSGYVAANFNGANSSGVIDQWLISPEITVEDGDVLKFWYRSPDNNPFDDSIFVHYSKDAEIEPDKFGETWGRFLVSETGWAQWVGAFNHNETVRFAIQYYVYDGGPNGLYSNYIGLDLFEVSKPCPIDVVTNPSPADGVVDFPVSGNYIQWMNGAGADSTSVYFGEIDNLQLIYDGVLIDSLSLASIEPLNCNTTYIWQVVGKNDTCQVFGPNWTFTTIPSPVGSPSTPSPRNGSINVPLAGNTVMWTNGINTVNNRVYFGKPDSLSLVYDGPAITSLSLAGVEPLTYGTTYTWQVVSDDAFCETSGPIWSFLTERDPNIVCAFMDDFSGTINWSAVNLNDVCDWGYSNTPDIPESSWGAPDFPVTADSFYAYASSDACGNEMNVYFTGNFTVDASQYQSVWIEFDSDFEVFLTPDPADTAAVDVSIDSTASWTRVFLRNADSPAEHAVIDISGLAALQRDIRFRLVYYGDFSWHWALDNFAVYLDDLVPPVGVENIVPDVFSLEQNYPNPFNPNTKIKFSLGADSRVTLTVFDILGQEVVTLINGNLPAGLHDIDFLAKNLNSGVYFYRIYATEVDGDTFTSVKKMILTK